MSLPDYKNLRNFSIEFDAQSPTTVIVGLNGAGKSNLIEAIVHIFRDLDDRASRQKTPFAYQIEYEIRGQIVDFDHDPGRRAPLSLSIDGEPGTASDIESVLPDTVFAYYSGPSNRLESLFEKPLSEFRDAMIRQDPEARQRLIYGRLIHSQFVLLSFLAESESKTFPFLERDLGIEGVDSVLFVMKQPYWAKGRIGSHSKPNFWGAQGTVRIFLDRLYRAAIAPLTLVERVSVGIKQYKSLEKTYLFLPSQEALRSFVNTLSSDEGRSNARELFTTLESAYVSDLIADVRVQLRKRDVDGRVTFRELSEGEQQLLMVLGLLRFTQEEESLFLLDEPDTHLNPTWSLKFLDLIEESVGRHVRSQLILASHDPVAISLLRRDQVRQLSLNSDHEVVASIPQEDPVKIGISGVLMSELFGFESVLAPEMLDVVRRRDVLRSLSTRGLEEEAELAILEEQSESVDLSSLHPDPLYARFLKEMLARQSIDLEDAGTLSRSAVLEQRRLTREILEEIDREGGQ